jgi:tetratricopeptide (TPR) repeat protein
MLTASLFLLTLAVPALPGDGDVLAKAQDHVSRGRLGDASILLSQALESGSGDEHALRLALADVHTKMGRAEEALVTLDGLDPTDADVALALGRAQLAQADAMASQGFGQEELDMALGRAREHLEVALESSGGTGPAVWDLGQFLLYRDGQLDAALELADSTISAHPDDGEALLLRGAAGAYVYWSASQADPPQVDAANEAWNKAVGDLEKANELLPRERLEPLGQLVWFYEAQDISGKAVDTAKAIAERQPEPDYGLLFRLARKYRDNGRLEASGKALATMVSMSARDLTNFIRDSEDPDRVASDLSGSIFPYYQRGDKATCRQVLAAIVAAEPQDAGVWDNYAVLCQETSRYDDAVSAYEHRLKIDDTDPRTYNDLGAIYQYFLQRDMDKAKELYDQCIDLADKQLAMIDAEPALKQNAAEAKRIAQDNLNQLRPGSSGTQGKGLLDSMVSGLRSLNLPKVGDNAEGEGDGEGEEDGDGDTEGESTGTEG